MYSILNSFIINYSHFSVFLPDTSSVKILKGKIALKRVDRVLHTAGVAVLIGVDESLELQYNYFPETKTVDMLTSVKTRYKYIKLYLFVHTKMMSYTVILELGDSCR